ncbi:MAG: PilN domain-containing protein [Candidatus Omnitrophota bacterium]|nr:PilN domain-containing protein [Candidatus Omnitrophota bacterium]MDZ4241931.1 PilN domain-containing protein [Candidatus Omnitrophota bacterium]
MRQINLLPEQMQKVEQIKTIRNAFVLVLAPILLVMAVVHVLLAMHLQNMKRLAERPMDYIQTREVGEVKVRIDEVLSKMRDFHAGHEILLESIAQRASTPVILVNLGEMAQSRVWLNDFNLDHESKTCRIAGQSFNTRLVSEFMLELKKVPFFKNVELSSMERGQDGKVGFSIVCYMKR